MKITMMFNLPDEQFQFDAARLGGDALSALWDIEQHCRNVLNHSDPPPELTAELQEILRLIPNECLDCQ